MKTLALKKIPASARIRRLAAFAVLAAASIVLGKLLQIPIGNTIRISLENLPIIFAGIVFGPAAGVAVGVVADIVGCLIVGYAINPIITMGAVVVGLTAGIAALPKKSGEPSMSYPRILLAVACAHIIGSMITKSIGLHIAFNTPWTYLLSTRIPIYFINIAVESALIFFILKSKAVSNALKPFIK